MYPYEGLQVTGLGQKITHFSVGKAGLSGEPLLFGKRREHFPRGEIVGLFACRDLEGSDGLCGETVLVVKLGHL